MIRIYISSFLVIFDIDGAGRILIWGFSKRFWNFLECLSMNLYVEKYICGIPNGHGLFCNKGCTVCNKGVNKSIHVSLPPVDLG